MTLETDDMGTWERQGLVRVLIAPSAEFRAQQAAVAAEMVKMRGVSLADVLVRKGLISQDDLKRVD